MYSAHAYSTLPYIDQQTPQIAPNSSLSPGSQRPMNLQDIIHNLNQDAENAGNPDLSFDNTATQIVATTESSHIYDNSNNGLTLVTVANTIGQTWGTQTFGESGWEF